MRQSISSSRVTSDSGTAFGCCEPARNTKSETVSSSLSSSRLCSSEFSARAAAAAARPSACDTPFGSMIMITEPSPKMVVPENTGMWRNFDDIGLMTISSVWKTPSTTTPNTWLPTCVTTTKPFSSSQAPRRKTSFRRTSGNSLLRRRSTGASLMCSMRCSPLWPARTSSSTASCGMAKRSPPASTMSADTIASVSGILMVNVVPAPLTDFKSTVPPICSILLRTTSMPTPRPEMLVTFAAVVKPAAKM